MSEEKECPFQTICPDCMEYLCRECREDSLELDAEYHHLKESSENFKVYAVEVVKRLLGEINFMRWNNNDKAMNLEELEAEAKQLLGSR